jgi:UDP:flavonoid glycosyltransferase YjiC (YdhE family)
MPTKRRIIINTGSFGDVHPSCLALELQSRGHEPVVATMAIYREKIQTAGLAFQTLLNQSRIRN